MLVYAKTLEARKAGILDKDETLPLNREAAEGREKLFNEKGELRVPTIEELMYDSSDESIALVEGYLKRMKRLVAGWEADFGKEMMTQEKAWINLMWSGDAVWAIEEASEVDVELAYTVPVEGSVVWFDGWVIPKYAVNQRAARYFIDFMCKPENAIRNMDATGYVSVVTNEEVLEQINSPEDYDEPIDLSYLFVDSEGNPIEGSDSVYTDPVLYPCRTVINRCAVMHDSGNRTDKMLEMWSRVKGDNLSTGMLVGIIVFFSILFIWGVARKINNYRKRQAHRKRRRHHYDHKAKH
jgi:spermidine/putrescine transport system substrate-binding protein